MKVRVITAIFIVAIALPVVLFSEYIVYPIVLSLLSTLGVFEMLRVIGLHKSWAVSIPAYVIALAMPMCSYFVSDAYRVLYLLGVFFLLFCYLIYTMAMAVFSKGKLPVSKLGVLYLSVSYVIASFTSLSTVRYIKNGLLCLFLVFFISWGTDAFAYLVGSAIGKHKLIPEVSPKKSVEGAIGGIFGSVLLSEGFAIFVWLVFSKQPNFLVIGIYAVVFSVVSQIGDLIASFIKREYNVKDYGTLMPGHGGVMDRFDSVLAAATPLLICSLMLNPFV